MNITVYLGSASGRSEHYTTAVRELGSWIGKEGHRLIYGGSKIGLMGELAESVLSTGGYVIGVEPQFLIDSCRQHESIQELIAVPDMSVRKAKMIELGDAFIAFPGGTGTLEEISEIMSAVCMGLIDKPCIIYNLDHYYDALHLQLQHMREEGFVGPRAAQVIHFVSSLSEIKALLSGGA